LAPSRSALAFASGMAAEVAAFLTHGRAGIVCIGDAYGGTLELIGQQLALLDIRHKTSDVTRIIASFPGVLELLPNEDRFFEDSTWRGYSKAIKSGAVPDAALLLRANDFWALSELTFVLIRVMPETLQKKGQCPSLTGVREKRSGPA